MTKPKKKVKKPLTWTAIRALTQKTRASPAKIKAHAGTGRFVMNNRSGFKILKPKQIGKTIRPDWKANVKLFADKMIKIIMSTENKTRKEAREILSNNNLFAGKVFYTEKNGMVMHFIVRYSFRDKLYYWKQEGPFEKEEER